MVEVSGGRVSKQAALPPASPVLVPWCTPLSPSASIAPPPPPAVHRGLAGRGRLLPRHLQAVHGARDQGRRRRRRPSCRGGRAAERTNLKLAVCMLVLRLCRLLCSLAALLRRCRQPASPSSALFTHSTSPIPQGPTPSELCFPALKQCSLPTWHSPAPLPPSCRAPPAASSAAWQPTRAPAAPPSLPGSTTLPPARASSSCTAAARWAWC